MDIFQLWLKRLFLFTDNQPLWSILDSKSTEVSPEHVLQEEVRHEEDMTFCAK